MQTVTVKREPEPGIRKETGDIRIQLSFPQNYFLSSCAQNPHYPFLRKSPVLGELMEMGSITATNNPVPCHISLANGYSLNHSPENLPL